MRQALRTIMIHATVILLAALYAAPDAAAQRRITPVDNPATTTQAKNEFEGDTARINARKRAKMVHYHDDNGNLVYVDTVTGEEWRDSTTIKAKAKAIGNIYPLFESLTVGVNIFDPVMRLTGQKYGLGEAWVMLNLHNRYQPVIEVGLGQAKATPDDGNFTYSSGVAPYFRIGANYNFLYNSNPDYQFYGGLRFGLTSFSYKITDVSFDNGYWGEDGGFDIPRQSTTACYYEVVFGCKVKLFGNLSAGWAVRYHRLMSESGGYYGQPWYIPGFGTRRSKIGAAFSIMYTIPINRKKDIILDGDANGDDLLPPPPTENSGEDLPDGILPGIAPGVGPDPNTEFGPETPSNA